MKKALNITGRVLGGLLLAVWLAVAAANYSLVQSMLGAYAGSRLSAQWGGEVHIGALHAMPWSHLAADNVRLVAPDGDTLLDVKHLRLHFKHFPYEKNHISIDRVVLRDGYYHLAVRKNPADEYETNLQYIFDYYDDGVESESSSGPITVDVGHLIVRRLRYKQDLVEEDIPYWIEGVHIAHMDFRDINIRARNIHVVNDDVSVRLLNFSTTEQSGMRVEHIEGNVHVSPRDVTVTGFRLRTPQSTVLGEVEILWDGWGGHEYLKDVQHRITLHPGTSVALADAAYWAPVLWGIDAQVEAEGHLDGTIGDMHITDFSAHWGENSTLQLTGDVRGLPDIETTVFDVDIERLRTTRNDILALGIDNGHAPQAHYARIDLPDLMLRQLQYADLAMRLHGGMNELGTVNLQLETGLGSMHADLMLTPLPHGGARFTAEAGSSGLGLRMLNTDWLSHTGFDLSASGTLGKLSDPRTLQGDAEGRLINSVVRGQHLAPVEFAVHTDDGRTTVGIESTDSLALFNLNADMRLFDSIKTISSQLNVSQLAVAQLNLTQPPYDWFSTHAELNYSGTSLDTMHTSLRLTDTRLGQLSLSNLTLNADADESKSLRLDSDPLEATVQGQFDYLDLPLIGMHLAHHLLPQDLFPVDTLYPAEREAIADDNVRFHLIWHDNEHLLQAVAPTLWLASGTRIDGRYSTDNGLNLLLSSGSVGLGNLRLDGLWLHGEPDTAQYRLSIESQAVSIGEQKLVQDVRLNLGTDSRQANLELKWDSDSSVTQGDLMLALEEGQVKVLQPDFTLGGKPWRLTADNFFISRTDRLHATGTGIGLHSDEQSLVAKLNLSGMPTDNLEVTLDNLQLQGLCDLVLQESPVSLAGAVDGRVSMGGLANQPYLIANLTIDSCHVNRQPLGEVGLTANWNAELNTVNLNIAGDQIAAGGWIELAGEQPELQLNADFNRFDLSLLTPLLSSFSSRCEGLLHGSIDIGGSLKQPHLLGEAQVEQGALLIDITGVTYYFNDSIHFNNNSVLFNDFHIVDPRSDTAVVNGTIDIGDLEHPTLDLDIHTDQLLVLDRPSGDDFYGTLLAAADGTVTGPVQDLTITVNARTASECSLTVPVNDRRQVKSQNYITFVSDEPQSDNTKTPRQPASRPNIELDLQITPDVQLGLPIDFSEVSVGVAARGAGDLHLSLSGTDAPQVVGSYELTSGTMKLGVLSIISKTFSLEAGSNLQFQGSLPDARFDLSAVYSQRVNMSTLTGGVDGMSGTQKYLQVEDVINIAGTLQDPTIGFDIRLPGADASVEEEVFAYIDRNSERDMLNQSVSLLAFGHFYNANATTANSNIATSGSIGALSSLLTDMVSVVDIDVDYKAGNELTKDQLDVNISKDWGRWYLESTLGYGGESRELQGSDANTAVIDALVGYRISPLVHLFAYNRTNTNDYTRTDLPYKQGIGLKLTKDFDRWTDLFKKQR